MNATYASGAYTRKTANISAQSIVEIKFTGDMGEVVAVYPQVCLTSAEPSSGRLNYSGRLICTLVYSDGENKLCRIQKGAEFSHHADDERIAPAQSCDCTLSCKHTGLKREGSAYVASVVINADAELSDRAERSYLSTLDGAVVKREEGKLFNAVSFSGESEVEDEFSLVATDILVPSAKAVVSDCGVKGGVIEVSGEIYLSLLAMREGSPVAADRAIPFKAEIPCEQAVVSCPASCRAEIKDMTVDCKVNEDRGKSDISFGATLSFSGKFFEEESVSLITDAFCVEKELNLNFSEESNYVCKDIKVYTERVSGLCAVKAKLDYTCAFLAAALPEAEFSRTLDGIGGSVVATLLYEQNGEIRSTEVNLPFSTPLSGLGTDCGDIAVAVSGMSIRQRAEGECEAEATLKITAADGETRSIKYLSEVTEGGDKRQDDCAISVYMPSAGDDLWATAKKLNAPPESVCASNPGLEFPLTGKERILIFRGKN